MNNLEYVLTKVEEPHKVYEVWNKISDKAKGYNPSVNKIISLVCDYISRENIRIFEEKHEPAKSFNLHYNGGCIKEQLNIYDNETDKFPITSDAKIIYNRIKQTLDDYSSKNNISLKYNPIYHITHNNNCCMLCLNTKRSNIGL